MNFKKYHVSRNLIDYTTVESTSYATATLIPGGITISGQYYVQFSSVNFTVGRSYTMSWTEKSISGTVRIMWRFRYSDGTYSVMPSSGISLIAEKEVSALLLYVNGSSTESGVAEITNIMLNEGSTALPCEPYSSEVWHDTPHYIHNTSTDTITTLPAVVYPNDTTATVGLKGNMSQASGVSPDNPIQPQETGERTGNLSDTLMGGISTSDGSDASYNPTQSQIRSQYIPCTEGTDYIVSANKYPVQNFVAFYDANKNYLSRTSGIPLTQARIFTTPANAAYMRATFVHATDEQLYPYSDGVRIMLNTGSTPLPYEPYGYFIEIEVS